MIRRSTAGLVVTIIALATIVTTTAVASATSYRYWTYWTGGSSWVFASSGAARVPTDGSVEGWRFEISATAASQPPRHSPDFARVCGTQPAPPGNKQVAVVIDYGTAADAPPGQSPPAGVIVHCAKVPTTFNGYQILQSVTSLRVEQGMVCGVSGYPARGCDEPATAPPPTPPPTTAKAPGSPSPSPGRRSSGPSSATPTTSPSPTHSIHATRPHPRPSVSTVAADATVAAAAATPSSSAGGTVSGPWALAVVAAMGLVAGGVAWWSRQRRQGQR